MTAGPHWIVFDLDGVFRQWNDPDLDEVESSFGLEPRTILSIAFSDDLGPAAITGQLTYRAWMDRIRAEVIRTHGEEASPALDVWEYNVGVVDWEMIEMLRQVREQIPVALLSNGTTRLRRDLHVLGIAEEFDTVFNTAELGIAKPDPAVFRLVCSSLGTETHLCAFVDDLEQNVLGAESVGMTAHRHVDQKSTESFLREMGLAIA